MKLFFSVLFISMYILVNAQECTYVFSGKVEDFHDKSVLENATVYIKNQNKYGVTDRNGNFRIKNVCKGELIIEVAHISCDTKTFSFVLSENTYQIIDLEHHIEELETVKINSNLSEKKSAQISTLKTDDIDNYTDSNLGDVLKEISGVSSLNTGNSIVKPIINGLHSSRVLVFNNNVRLQDQDWGVEHAPNVDISSAGKISVIKGANALEYSGDAIGGIVLINPNNIIRKDTLFGKTIISQQTNTLGTTVSSNLTKSFSKGWFINANVLYKHFGDGKSPNYYLTNTGLNSKSASIYAGLKTFETGFDVHYSYINNEIGILSSSHLGSTSDLAKAINNGTPLIIKDFSFDINNPKQDVTHHTFKGLFYNRFKGLGKFEVQYDYQNNRRFEYDIRKGKYKEIPSLDLKLQTHTFLSSFNFDFNKNNTYKVGILARYQNNFANPDTKVRRLIPDYDKWDAGIFAITNYSFDNWRINAGVRYEFNYYDAKKYYLKSRWNSLNYNADFGNTILLESGNKYLANLQFDYHSVSASVGSTYKVNDNSNIIFNYGLSNRAPNPSELFSDGLHHSAARIEIGSLLTEPEMSHRFGLSYNFMSEKNLSVKIEGFYSRINDFIYIEPTGVENSLRGSFPVYTYNQVDANLLGFDSTIAYHIFHNWVLTNKSSYIFGEDTSNNRPLIDIPPFKTVFSLQYTNEKWYDFNAKLTSEFTAKQNRYPNNNFDAYIAELESDILIDVSSTPKSYHLLNFSSDIKFNLSKTQLTIGVMADNILNSSYRNYLNRLRYFSDDLGRNFKIQLKINY